LGTQLQEALTAADACSRRAEVLKEDNLKMASELFAAQEALRGHGAGVSYRKIDIDIDIDIDR